MAISIVINCEDGTETIVPVADPTPVNIPLPPPVLNVVNGNVVFAMPVIASDFVVQTPDVPTDPATALTEAIKESRKGKGASKSLAYILLALVNYIEDVEKRLKKAKI